MIKRQRLLVVLDEDAATPQPEPALERAAFLAGEMNAVIEILACENPTPPGPAGADPAPAENVLEPTAWLQELAKPLTEKGLSVCTSVESSRHPYDAILRKVTAAPVDMVIKTTRHDSRLNRTLFNYTDWHLIRNCPCPLLLAKGEDNWTTRRIVACVDPAHPHSRAETLDCVIFETARVLAHRLRGELHVFHAIRHNPLPVPFPITEEHLLEDHEIGAYEEEKALLDEFLKPYRVNPRRVHVAIGRPERTLEAFVEAIDASLVVMGAVSKGALESLFIGNTAEKVLDELHCDILVVKSNPIEVKVTSPAPCLAC
jgi:universal stress protein E